MPGAPNVSEPFGFNGNVSQPFGFTGNVSEPFGFNGNVSEAFGFTGMESPGMHALYIPSARFAPDQGVRPWTPTAQTVKQTDGKR